MFGLEKKKQGGRPEEETFELEVEMQSSTKHKEMEKKIDLRIQEVKKLLRDGGDQEVVDDLGLVLHGYAALKKVIGRLGR
jgi:Family of unknown function (DUF5398)